MTASDARRLRRILVALDASPASRDALLAAVLLAGRSGAELEGIFVEDADVLRAAALPFAAELSLPSGAPRPLRRREVEAELRALAAAAREALAAAARQGGVGWSFRVARGRVTVELLAAAGGADLLVLGRSGHGVGPAPGGTARGAAARAQGPVLLHGGGATDALPVAVAYDGSAGAGRALDVALLLAGDGGPVRVLVAAATAAEADRLAAHARERGGLASVEARWLRGAGRAELVRAACDWPGLLVLDAGSQLLGAGGPEALLRDVDAPVVLVR